MNRIITTTILSVIAVLCADVALAQQQQENKLDIDKIIEKSVENVDKYVHLDDVQIFYLDSIYQTNFRAMYSEMDAAKAAGSSNPETYLAISDSWMEKCDVAIEKILTPEQWQKYLKCGYGKERKAREKRAASKTQQIRK